MNKLETIQEDFKKRYQDRDKERERRKKHLLDLRDAKGDWRQVDLPERIVERARRLGLDETVNALLKTPGSAQTGSRVLEQIIGANNLLGVRFLFKGADSARAVGRILLPVSGGTRLGTGFMVSPRVMMTNNHVLETADQAGDATLEFDFFEREGGGTGPVKRFRLQPERLFATDESLDFTVVAVEETNNVGDAVADRGFHPLIGPSGKAVVGERVSIIQHPGGAPQQVAIHENLIVDVLDDFLHYATDTQGGSSGSGVFNDDWELVALHHAAVGNANEGIRISRIVERLKEIFSEEATVAGGLVEDVLSGRGARRPSPVPPSPFRQPEVVSNQGTSWVVPMHIQIGFGGGKT